MNYRRLAVLGTVVAAAVPAAVAGASTGTSHVRGAAARERSFRAYERGHLKAHTASGPTRSPDDGDLLGQAAQYSNERTAPGASLSGGALVAAQRQAAKLASIGGAWQEVTTKPYQAQPAQYTDPFWGNEGAGFDLVGGRTTALASTADGTWFAGTADGGVWRSTDQGGHWSATFDSMPSLSIGALGVAPDGSLWVGTGEANTSQDSYAGTGVYRSTDDGASYQRIGDASDGSNPIAGRTVFQLAFAPDGTVYAATNNGLWRLASGATTWNEVFVPDGGAPDPQPYYTNQVTSVAVVPGTDGRDVIAAAAWRSADLPTNGFYNSTDGGLTFHKVRPAGDVKADDIGRTTFAYSADGTRLYAIVESPAALLAGKESVLQGIYSASGAPAGVAGPWRKIADEAKLAASGSALAVHSGYGVGVQAWYNQTLAVDPANPDHVYAGLEEVFETSNGGNTWNTASPYWNYNLPCGAACPKTTHPDQHALMLVDGKVVSGNDGGVYSRPLSDTQQYGDWSDLNATLHTWQYYDARAGRLGSSGLGVVGGLQDNGTSVLDSNERQMVEPAGGDGFDVIVDPANANRMVGEYTDGTMYSSTNGGHTFFIPVSPTCAAQATVGLPGGPRPDCDPAARFVTPLIQDQQNANVWVTGGQFVWVSHDGWNTRCTNTVCTWKNVFDTGAGNAVTALSSADGGRIVYAAWVANGGNPGAAFAAGIASNYGGTWHQLSMAGLPNRYIAGVTVDPSNPAHAYAVFNGYSRRWIPGGGVGHVFETTDGGASWTDISGNLPDIASDALVLRDGKLALATDAGVYAAKAGQGAATSWSRMGSGLPNTSINDLTLGPDGWLYAATHGRGIWRERF